MSGLRFPSPTVGKISHCLLPPRHFPDHARDLTQRLAQAGAQAPNPRHRCGLRNDLVREKRPAPSDDPAKCHRTATNVSPTKARVSKLMRSSWQRWAGAPPSDQRVTVTAGTVTRLSLLPQLSDLPRPQPPLPTQGSETLRGCHGFSLNKISPQQGSETWQHGWSWPRARRSDRRVKTQQRPGANGGR
jgi:hypothetical protein